MEPELKLCMEGRDDNCSPVDSIVVHNQFRGRSSPTRDDGDDDSSTTTGSSDESSFGSSGSEPEFSKSKFVECNCVTSKRKLTTLSTSHTVEDCCIGPPYLESDRALFGSIAARSLRRPAVKRFLGGASSNDAGSIKLEVITNMQVLHGEESEIQVFELDTINDKRTKEDEVSEADATSIKEVGEAVTDDKLVVDVTGVTAEDINADEDASVGTDRDLAEDEPIVLRDDTPSVSQESIDVELAEAETVQCGESEKREEECTGASTGVTQESFDNRDSLVLMTKVTVFDLTKAEAPKEMEESNNASSGKNNSLVLTAKVSFNQEEEEEVLFVDDASSVSQESADKTSSLVPRTEVSASQEEELELGEQDDTPTDLATDCVLENSSSTSSDDDSDDSSFSSSESEDESVKVADDSIYQSDMTELFGAEYSLEEYETKVYLENMLERLYDNDKVVDELDEDSSNDEWSEVDADATDSMFSLNTLEKAEFEEFFTDNAPKMGCMGLMLDLTKVEEELDAVYADDDTESVPAPATEEPADEKIHSDTDAVTGINLTEAEPALLEPSPCGDQDQALEKGSAHSKATNSTYVGTASEASCDENDSLNFHEEESDGDLGPDDRIKMESYEDGNIEILGLGFARSTVDLEMLQLEDEILDA